MKITFAALLLTLTAGVLRADSSTMPSTHPAAHPENRIGLGEFQGKIQSIDVNNQVFQIRDAKDKDLVVGLDASSRILNDKNKAMALSDLKKNDLVVVYVDRTDGIARQVDLRPTVEDVILGK